MKRKALGKGLTSLIPSPPPRRAAKKASGKKDLDAAADTGLVLIDIDRIRPNRSQPRRYFDGPSLESLAKSLKPNGFIQPVTVRPASGDVYELVAGERRWRAAQLAGLLRIPAVISEVADERLLEMALVENLQREDLNPMEEAAAYRSLMDDFGLTQQQVASRVGKPRATIANFLRLLTLPRAVQEKVRKGGLGMGHARALAALSSPSRQTELAGLIEKQGLAVRQVEKMVARLAADAGPAVSGSRKKRKDPNVESAEQNLQRLLGARVRIVPGKKGGRLEIHYYDEDELQRIYRTIYDAAKS